MLLADEDSLRQRRIVGAAHQVTAAPPEEDPGGEHGRENDEGFGHIPGIPWGPVRDQLPGTGLTSHDSAAFLRRSLQLDGVASGLTGALLLVAAGPVSTLIGNAAPAVARLGGAGLLVFAAALLWNARRGTVARGEVVAAVLLNIAWVIGSVALIALGPLPVLGNVAVAAVALAVLGFTLLEIVGLRRLRAA